MADCCDLDMADIAEILDMLDWHMPQETQSRGISLASNLGTIIPFLQPLTPEHNKNVWENCAVITANKSDEELKPYFAASLEWLQDMNWPGAFCILNRLQRCSNDDSIRSAIAVCIGKAKDCGDNVWERNLHLLLREQ